MLPKLAVFDVDGTLIGYDGHCSPRTRSTLRRLRAAGVTTAIATGRPLASLPETFAQIGPVDYAVCSNGGTAVEVATGRVIMQSEVPADIVASIVPAMRRNLPGVGVAIDIGDQTIEEPGFDRRLPPRDPVEPVPDALAALGSPIPPVGRVTFFHDDYDAAILDLADLVRPHLDDRVELWNAFMLAIVEVIPAGNDKAVALDALVGDLGMTASDVVAFGDGTNDVAMVRWAGMGVAMGNAADVLIDSADLVIGAIADDGVAEFLDPLLDSADPGDTA